MIKEIKSIESANIKIKKVTKNKLNNCVHICANVRTYHSYEKQPRQDASTVRTERGREEEKEVEEEEEEVGKIISSFPLESNSLISLISLFLLFSTIKLLF